MSMYCYYMYIVCIHTYHDLPHDWTFSNNKICTPAAMTYNCSIDVTRPQQETSSSRDSCCKGSSMRFPAHEIYIHIHIHMHIHIHTYAQGTLSAIHIKYTRTHTLSHTETHPRHSLSPSSHLHNDRRHADTRPLILDPLRASSGREVGSAPLNMSPTRW